MTNYNEFLLERYRYILSQKKSLNEATFKIAGIYQAAVVAVGAAQYGIFTEVRAAKLDVQSAIYFNNCVFVFFSLVTFLTVCLLLGGVFSWVDYRKDEAGIEITVFGVGRSTPAWGSIFRWYETYLTLAVVCFFAIGVYSHFHFVLPLVGLGAS